MKQESKIQIFVRGGSKTQTISCKTDESIESVKIKIQEADGIPPEQQRLIYGGSQLEDGKTLKEYNVQAESTIQVVVRLCGC